MNSPDQPSFQLPTSKNWVILGSMIFGCASTFLWVVDFLRLFRSMIGICGVVIIILGNAIESWTLYSSLSSGSICKIIRIIIFSIIVLIGLMIFGTSSIIDRAISSFSIVSSLIEVFYLIFGIVILIKQNRDIVQNINDRVNNQRNQNVTQTQVNSILSPDILMIEHFDDDRNLSGNDSNLTINFSTQTENRNSFYYAYDFEDLSLSKKKELELEDIQDMQCEISPYGLGKDKYYPPEIENDGKQIEGIPNIQKDIMSNPYSTAGTNNLATFGNYIV